MSKYLPDTGSVLKIGGSVVLVALGTVGALLYRFQTKLIYPASMPADSRTNVATPDQYGIPFDDLTLTTPDGVRIKAYLMLQKEKARNKPTILFFHANAGNAGHRLPLVKVFYSRLGYNVMLLSYRGYGLSEGEPNEKGMCLDAQTAIDHVLSHLELEKTPIFVYGQSIGGAVAIYTASRNINRVRGLIVENTFTSLPRLVPSVVPFLAPFMLLLHQIWPSYELIQKVPKDFPVLFLSGDKDELVPQFHMGELYVWCSSQNKHWRDFKDGTHNDTCIQPGYFDHIKDFIALNTGTTEKSEGLGPGAEAEPRSAALSRVSSDAESFELVDDESEEIQHAGGAGSVDPVSAATHKL